MPSVAAEVGEREDGQCSIFLVRLLAALELGLLRLFLLLIRLALVPGAGGMGVMIGTTFLEVEIRLQRWVVNNSRGPPGAWR